jgi:hypothetical protein
MQDLFSEVMNRLGHGGLLLHPDGTMEIANAYHAANDYGENRGIGTCRLCPAPPNHGVAVGILPPPKPLKKVTASPNKLVSDMYKKYFMLMAVLANGESERGGSFLFSFMHPDKKTGIALLRNGALQIGSKLYETPESVMRLLVGILTEEHM